MRPTGAGRRRGGAARVGGDAGDRLPRFAVEADVGDPDQLDPGEEQVVGAFPVFLEGEPGAVVA